MMLGCTYDVGMYKPLVVTLAWPWAVARRLCDLRVLGRQLSGNREVLLIIELFTWLEEWEGKGRGDGDSQGSRNP